MADSVLDFAGLDSAAATTESVDSGVNEEIETPTNEEGESSGEGTGKDSDEGESGEGSEEVKDQDKGKEGSEEKKEGSEKLPGSKTTPQNIRKTLKAIQDSNPENKEAVKVLHGAYERWEAAKQIFPKGVAEMKAAKELNDLIGGQEGYEKIQTEKAAIEAIDAKLFGGDLSLVQDIRDDLKEAGKLDVFPKLAMGFLDSLQKQDGDAYYEQMIPHFVGLLEEVNIHGVFNGLVTSLSGIKEDSKPEEVKAAITRALGIASKANEWVKSMQARNEKAKTAVESPEQKKLAEDRKKFEEEQKTFKTNQTKAFQSDVVSASNKADNDMLGKELSPFLKMPFFKGFTRENLRPLAVQIQENLRTELKNDKVYQAQMKNLWGAKEPSKEKIMQYHSGKVKDIAARIVRSTVQTMYPGHTKGGAAAGRVAAQTAKKEADTKAATQATQSGKPVYVVSKPKDLVRNTDIVVGGKPYKSSDLITMEITGKGFVKTADGKGFKYVTWRK